MQRRINVDEKRFAPYVVHPWAPVNLDAQIPKKGDQRQMEAWQRIGTYAAGLALDSAGVKGNKEILAGWTWSSPPAAASAISPSTPRS